MNRRQLLIGILSLPLYLGKIKLSLSKENIEKGMHEYISSKLNNKKIIKSKSIKVFFSSTGEKEVNRLAGCDLLNKNRIRTTIKTNIEDVKTISLFIQKPNKNIVFLYSLSANTFQEITNDIKITENTNIIAVAETNTQLYYRSVYINLGVTCCVGG